MKNADCQKQTINKANQLAHKLIDVLVNHDKRFAVALYSSIVP